VESADLERLHRSRHQRGGKRWKECAYRYSCPRPWSNLLLTLVRLKQKHRSRIHRSSYFSECDQNMTNACVFTIQKLSLRKAREEKETKWLPQEADAKCRKELRDARHRKELKERGRREDPRVFGVGSKCMKEIQEARRALKRRDQLGLWKEEKILCNCVLVPVSLEVHIPKHPFPISPCNCPNPPPHRRERQAKLSRAPHRLQNCVY